LRSAIAAVALSTLTLVACGSDDSSADADAAMTIVDAWSRQPAAGQTAAVVYGVVSNPNDVDVTITAATSAVSDDVELHETLVADDDTMSMQEAAEGFIVPAGGSFTFEPGGAHIMLLGVDPDTYPDSVDVTLDFDGTEPLSFDAEVRSLVGDVTGEMDDLDEMDDMDHGGSDDTDTTMAMDEGY
jgi:copper(I)-binding protein